MLTEIDVGAVTEAEVWLGQLRTAADRAAHARAVGSQAMEVAARAAGRSIIDRITVLLLQQHATSPAGALSEAIAAACTAELARLEGRNEAWRWRLAAHYWERAGRPEETEAARRRADVDRRAARTRAQRELPPGDPTWQMTVDDVDRYTG